MVLTVFCFALLFFVLFCFVLFFVVFFSNVLFSALGELNSYIFTFNYLFCTVSYGSEFNVIHRMKATGLICWVWSPIPFHDNFSFHYLSIIFCADIKSNDFLSPRIRNEPNLTDICHSTTCGCDNMRFQPSCGSDGVLYYSPCHAGCHVYDNDTKVSSMITWDVMPWKRFPHYWPCVRGIHLW